MDDRLHGGALDLMATRFPDAMRPWADLSTGINPWPWQVPEDLLTDGHLLTDLPTQSAFERCRTAMAQAFDAAEETVLPVCGTSLAIALVPQILAAQHVTVLSPSYGDHARAWPACTVEETNSPLLECAKADVIVVCNPNNPDGRLFTRSDLLAARGNLAKTGGTLIVDEAYGELAPSHSVASEAIGGNLIVLRSFGKFYGLAGIRLGAVIAAPHLLGRIRNLLGDWPVSALALAIGQRAYADMAFGRRTRARLKQARLSLDTVLQDAGLALKGGTDLFRFIETHDAYDLWTHLAQHGLYVRRFSWSTTHLRIGMPNTAAAQERLASALSSWRHS